MRSALVLLLVWCPSIVAAQRSFDSRDWQVLLDRYRGETGFGYAALHANAGDRARLERVARSIDQARPAAWSRDARLGFYLDAYNVLVVRAVIAHWPLRSVTSVRGFFDREPHRLAGRTTTLNQLENDVLRGREFAEPRVHFALNCASRSCPPLAARAWSSLRGRALETALANATRAFVRRTTRVEPRAIVVSRIFEWYAADFPGGARAFVAAALEPAEASHVRRGAMPLSFAEYDWTINAR